MKPYIKKTVTALVIVATINAPPIALIWFLHNNLVTTIDRHINESIAAREKRTADYAAAREKRKADSAAARANEDTARFREEMRDSLKYLREGQKKIQADVLQLQIEVSVLTSRVGYIEKHVDGLEDMHRGTAIYYDHCPYNEKPQ